MLILAITALMMMVAATSTWLIASHSPGRLLAPRVPTAKIQEEVRQHSFLAKVVRSRLDPATATGLALTFALSVVVLGAVGFAVLLFMVRTNSGFAHFDLGAARFGARNATAVSTVVLRSLTQLGGALFLVPAVLVVTFLGSRRHQRPLSTIGFLALTVGGQFALTNIIKVIVNRARPTIDQLTGFSSKSFPSGHAVAAAASFAAFALVLSRGRSSRVKGMLAAGAVGLAVGIGCTRIFLGVHWLTDVIAGLILGWAWFALCSIAFGGRLLHFGAPAEQAEQAVATTGTSPGHS